MSKNPVFRNLTSGIKLKPPKLKPLKAVECQTSVEKEKNQNISTDVRSLNKIQVFGEDIPEPITSFEELSSKYSVNSVIFENLQEAGYTAPTPVQMQAIPLMMDRREVISSAPTGSGKTLAFLLPIIFQLKKPKSIGFRALILVPTRELAKQLHREFLWLSRGTDLRIYVIDDLETAKTKFGRKSDLKKDIVITTPKKLIHLLSTDPPSIHLKHLRWLVIDECDKLFEKCFKEQLATIYQEVAKAKRVRRAMFSATFNDELEKWFQMNLDNVVTLIVGGKNTAADEVEQRLQFVGSEEGKLVTLKDHIARGMDAPVLIFVDEKEKGKKLFKELIVDGINVEVIHAERHQSQRDKIVSQFREGKILFLICTELMSRGIDLKAVNTVVNYDLPPSDTSYIHRIGRAGRAGRHGTAITFYTEQDFRKLCPVIRVMKQSGCKIPEFLESQITKFGKRKMNEPSKRKQKTKKLNKSDAC